MIVTSPVQEGKWDLLTPGMYNSGYVQRKAFSGALMATSPDHGIVGTYPYPGAYEYGKPAKGRHYLAGICEGFNVFEKLQNVQLPSTEGYVWANCINYSKVDQQINRVKQIENEMRVTDHAQYVHVIKINPNTRIKSYFLNGDPSVAARSDGSYGPANLGPFWASAIDNDGTTITFSDVNNPFLPGQYSTLACGVKYSLFCIRKGAVAGITACNSGLRRPVDSVTTDGTRAAFIVSNVKFPYDFDIKKDQFMIIPAQIGIQWAYISADARGISSTFSWTAPTAASESDEGTAAILPHPITIDVLDIVIPQSVFDHSDKDFYGEYPYVVFSIPPFAGVINQ